MLTKDADVIFNDECGLWQGVMSLWGFWCLAIDLSVVRHGCMEETSHANLSEIRELPCLVESLA
jgi:hypothetical protein